MYRFIQPFRVTHKKQVYTIQLVELQPWWWHPTHIYNTAVNQMDIPFYQFSQLRCLKANEIILLTSFGASCGQNRLKKTKIPRKRPKEIISVLDGPFVLPIFGKNSSQWWSLLKISWCHKKIRRTKNARCGCPGLPKFCILGRPAMEDALACLEVRTASWQIFSWFHGHCCVVGGLFTRGTTSIFDCLYDIMGSISNPSIFC